MPNQCIYDMIRNIRAIIDEKSMRSGDRKYFRLGMRLHDKPELQADLRRIFSLCGITDVRCAMPESMFGSTGVYIKGYAPEARRIEEYELAPIMTSIFVKHGVTNSIIIADVSDKNPRPSGKPYSIPTRAEQVFAEPAQTPEIRSGR